MTGTTEDAPDHRDFALAIGFVRTDDDPRPIAEISEADLLTGFGAVVPTHP
jgi:hypothetical protein